MVMNHVLLRQKHYSKVYTDIAAVRNVAPHPIILKVILETSQLSPREIIAGCKIAEAAGADYVKTSTGFNGQGATQENVRLMKSVVGDTIKVKASGECTFRSLFPAIDAIVESREVSREQMLFMLLFYDLQFRSQRIRTDSEMCRRREDGE